MADEPPIPAIKRFGWKPEDDALLREMVKRRLSLGEMAAALGRSHEAVRSRSGKLRLPLKTTHRPWRLKHIPGAR